MKKVATSILLVFLLTSMLFPAAVLAHSGRTDGAGGHHDYNNVSGLGSYHYHHGYGPHLHPNGVCPYSSPGSSSATSSSSSSTSSSSADEYDEGYDDGYDIGRDNGYKEGRNTTLNFKKH